MTGSDTSLLFRSAIATSVSNLDSFRRDRPKLDSRKEGWTERWGIDKSTKSTDDEAADGPDKSCGWRARPEDWDAELVVGQRCVNFIRSVINISPYTYLIKDLYTYFLLRLIRLQHQGIGHAVSIDTTDINSASGGMARTAGPSHRQGPSHRHQLIVSGVRGLGTVAVPQGCRVFDQDKRGGRG